MSANGSDERLLGLLPDLYRFARFLGASGADADDLVQETLMKAWRERQRLKPGADPRPYVFTICRNVQRDKWRKAKRTPDPLAEPDLRAAPEISGPDPTSLEDLKERLPGEVWNAIESLPENYRAVLFLTAVMGLTGREVAEILGWPGGTVRSIYSRARAALRSALVDA
ncbi:MAG: RNA polymerase sigma factor [Planctomycetota bacterium]